MTDSRESRVHTNAPLRTIRSVDLELACAIVEKERLLVSAARHDAVMKQDAEIERLVGRAVRLRGIGMATS